MKKILSWIIASLFLICITFVYADLPLQESIYNESGMSVWGSGTLLGCVNFTANVNLSSVITTTPSDNTADGVVLLLDSNKQPLHHVSGLSGGEVVQINYNMTEGVAYDICTNSTGGGDIVYHDGYSFPKNMNLSNSTSSVNYNSGWGVTAGRWYGFINITFVRYVPPTPTAPSISTNFTNVFSSETGSCILEKETSWLVGYICLIILILAVWLLNTLLIRIPFFGIICGLGFIFATLNIYGCNTWVGILMSLFGVILMASDITFIVTGRQLTGHKRY